MLTRVGFVSAAIALAASSLGAQGAVRLQLAPGSQLSFTGTSTLHAFNCTTKDMQAYVDVDQGYRTKDLSTIDHPIAAVRVVIPLKSLSCGGELEGNMLKTLKANEHPYVTYTLATYDLVPGRATATSFSADTKGKLSISGTENPISMRVDATRSADGVITATGDQALKMSEYGITPPKFMLGTLRVGDEVKVHFTIKATAPAVSSALRELGLPANATLALLPQ